MVILDDGNFDEDDPKTIVYVRCIAMRNRVKQRKTFKNDISKELMPAAWHTTWRWTGACQKVRKKKYNPFLLMKLVGNKSSGKR